MGELAARFSTAIGLAFGRLGIRARLVCLVLALALPFAGHAIHASIDEARTERENVATQMLATAQTTAARLDDHIGDMRSILRVLGTVVTLDPARAADNRALLKRLESQLPAFVDNLVVWSPAGADLGSLNPIPEDGLRNAATRSYFRDAAQGVPFTVEAPVRSLVSRTVISAFGLPIRRDGQLVGIVSASVRLDALQRLLASAADLPPGAVVTVLNGENVVLARSVDSEHWVGRTLRLAGSGSGLGADGVRDGPGADGVERLGGLTSTEVAPWRVYVGVPAREALVPVRLRLRNHLISAGLILLGGLFLALLVADGIASPLRQLERDSRELGAGNLAHRSAVTSVGEIGRLAATLNRMAGQLQERSQALWASKTQLRQVTDNLPALISYVDRDQRFRFVNKVYEDWLGKPPDQMVGRSLREVYGAETHARIEGFMRRALGGERVSYARELDTLEGRKQVEVTAIPDTGAGGTVLGLFVMMIDVTARREAETALRQSERRLKTIADRIPALVTYVDQQERYRFVNAYLGDVFKADPENLVGRTVRETAGQRLYAQIAPHIAAALRGEQATFQGVWTVADRTYHYQSTYIPDADDEGRVRGYYAMTFDITALKESQRRLDVLARVDSLTGLPNRRQFEERFQDAMARTRDTGVPLALMFLDIDHFKAVNDSLGHGAGDAVLREFAARLRAQVRPTDVVARLAGDEFVILMEGVHGPRDAEAVAAKIVESVRAPLALEHRSIRMTTSIGVAVYEGGADTASELLATADRALYAAKRHGRDRYALAAQGAATVHALPTGAAPPAAAQG